MKNVLIETALGMGIIVGTTLAITAVGWCIKMVILHTLARWILGGVVFVLISRSLGNSVRS